MREKLGKNHLVDALSILIENKNDLSPTPEQKERIGDLIKHCNKNYSNQGAYGNDALNRLVLLDPIVADIISDLDILNIILKSPKEQFCVIRTPRNKPEILLDFKDVLLHGFKHSLEVLKYHPNNERDYGLKGYEEQQSKFEKNTVRIIRAIGTLVGENSTDLTFVEDSVVSIKMLFREVCDDIDFLAVSDDLKKQLLAVPGYTYDQIMTQTNMGFLSLIVRLGYQMSSELTQKTLTEFCEQVLNQQEVFLDGSISHLLYDRLHLTAALVNEKAYSFSDTPKISLSGIFSKLVEMIDANPAKYAVVKKQFEMRLNLVYQKLHEKFYPEFLALKKLNQEFDRVGTPLPESLDEQGTYLLMKGPLPKSIYTKTLEEIVKLLLEPKNTTINYQLIDRTVYIHIKNETESDKIYNLSDILKYANLQHLRGAEQLGGKPVPSRTPLDLGSDYLMQGGYIFSRQSNLKNKSDGSVATNQASGDQEGLTEVGELFVDSAKLVMIDQMLLPEERRAIHDYTENSYSKINSLLRGFLDPEYFLQENQKICVEKVTGTIRSVFFLATGLQKIVVEFHPEKKKAFCEQHPIIKRFILKYPNMPDYKSLSLHQFISNEQGFQSATASSKFNVDKFLKPVEPVGVNNIDCVNNTRITFNFSIGSRGALIAPWANSIVREKEMEHLFFPSQYRVTKHAQDENGNQEVSLEEVADLSALPEEAHVTDGDLCLSNPVMILRLFDLYDKASRSEKSRLVKSYIEELLYIFEKSNKSAKIENIGSELIELIEDNLNNQIDIGYLSEKLIDKLSPILSLDVVDVIYHRYRQSPTILRLVSDPVFSFLEKNNYVLESEAVFNVDGISYQLNGFKSAFSNFVRHYFQDTLTDLSTTEKNKLMDGFLSALITDEFNLRNKVNSIYITKDMFSGFIEYQNFKDKVSNTLKCELEAVFPEKNENTEKQKKEIQDVFLSFVNPYSSLELYVANTDLLSDITQKIGLIKQLIDMRIDSVGNIGGLALSFDYEVAFRELVRNACLNLPVEVTSVTTLNENHLKDISNSVEQLFGRLLIETLCILIFRGKYDVLMHLISTESIARDGLKYQAYDRENILDSETVSKVNFCLDNTFTELQRKCLRVVLELFCEINRENAVNCGQVALFRRQSTSTLDLCKSFFDFFSIRVSPSFDLSELVDAIEEKQTMRQQKSMR